MFVGVDMHKRGWGLYDYELSCGNMKSREAIAANLHTPQGAIIPSFE